MNCFNSQCPISQLPKESRSKGLGEIRRSQLARTTSTHLLRRIPLRVESWELGIGRWELTRCGFYTPRS
jgi:hypothetical protein